jgi:hypothetical protein
VRPRLARSDPGLQIGPARVRQFPRGIATVRASGAEVEQLLDLVESEPKLLSAIDEPE